tara:strand:- start:1211 stop:4558 length:3348 start_codon:yes stop_codon:yes gene_type:complete
MAKYEFLQPKFIEGVLAKSLQGRSSEEFYHYGYKSSKNLIPVLSGPVVKRPGTNYIGEAKDPTAVFVPFFKDKDNTYIIELGILIETVTSSITSGDATVTVSDTSRLSINQPVTGTGIPAGATIASITDSTDFELSVTASATNGSASLSISIGYLRVWSQNQLLKERTGNPGTTHATNIYETVSSVPWTSAQLETLKFTQSGDIIFVCCPDKKPHRIFRTLVTSGTRAADDSFWTVDEFVMTDGPYKSINIWSEDDAAKRFSLKLETEPTNLIEIGTVEFNTVDDSLVLANHGLQTGQKIALKASGTGWGNVRQRETSASTTQTKMNGGATGSGTDVFDLDNRFVVSSTGTSFQFSDGDGGDIRKFELYESTPTTTTSNAEIKVHKYAYAGGTTGINLVLYVNNNSGSQAATKTYFSSNDVGRLIRINPLMKAGSQIGGIKWSWGVITAVDNSGTNGKITITTKTELSNTRGSYGTSEFRLGAFSDGEGWPHVAQIYQQRMVLAANTMQPSTIWLSETAQFYSFAPTVLADQGTQQSFTDGVATEIIIDSSALTFTLDSDTLDSIKWLAESKKLTMGTSAGVYMLYGAETNLTVTPFRFTINRETSFSATDTAPIVVSNALLYAQIGGKDVQSLELEGGTANQWLASKISMKGYDIIKSSEIKKMVWQERPNNLIWFMMADGRLLTLSYDRGAEFKAWSEHVLGGSLYRKIILTSKSTTPAKAVVTDSSGDQIADSGNKILFTNGEAGSPTAHALNNTDIVQLTTTGTLPTGLSLSTNYYVVNKTANTFKLALTSGGADILWTDNGSGTHSWHKPTIYTVDGDNSSLYTVDENVVLSGYSISDWNSTQRVMAVTVNSSTDTEITTDFDSSGLANTTEAVSGRNPRISDENSANAQVVDMEMIPTASHDQIWFKVKRTIDGVDKYYIETLDRFPTEGALTRNQYSFSDSSVKGSVGTDKIINTLAHLKNEEVQVYYEGMQHVNKTVTATGSGTETITLDHTQGNEHVTGLPYDAELETLEPSAPDNQFSYTKRLVKIAVLVEESLGIQLEYNDLSEELLFRTTVDAMGRQIPLFSGLRKLSLSGIGWDTHNLKVVSNGPFPMQLNAIIIEAETGGS